MVFPRPAAPIFCVRAQQQQLQGHGGSHCFSVRQRRFSVPFLGLQMRRWRVFWWDSRTSSSFRAMVFPRPAAPIFCSVSIVSEAREVREFFGGILGLVRPSGPWCFPVRQRRFSVLFLGFQKRRYREFVGGILGLVRPCRAMVFPRPAAPIFCVCAQQQQQLLQGFRSDVRGFFGGILGLVQSAMVFPRPAAPIFCSVSRVSEATLEGFFAGILGLVRPSGPWCFPVRQRRFSVCAQQQQQQLLQGFRSDVREFFGAFVDAQRQRL